MSASGYYSPFKEKHKAGIAALCFKQEASDLTRLSPNRTMTDGPEACQSTLCHDNVDGKRSKADATEYRKRLKTIEAISRSDQSSACTKICFQLSSGKAEDGGQQLGIDCSHVRCPAQAKQLPDSPTDYSTVCDLKCKLYPQSEQDDECCAIRITEDAPMGASPFSENVAVCSVVLAPLDCPADVSSPAEGGMQHQQVAEETERLPVMLEAMDATCTTESTPAIALGSPMSPVRMPMQCSDDDRECASTVDADSGRAWPKLLEEHVHDVRMLGCGQFGKAYVARTRTDMNEVVIKMIQEDKYRDEEFILPYTYPHMNIIKMHCRMHLDRYTFLFQDYVQGRALDGLWHDNVQRGRTLDDADLDVLGFQMFDALRHLDDHRIVHRDIKPANIIKSYCYKKGTQYVLIDFGFSEQLMVEEVVRCVDGFRGSLAYCAPECCRPCPKSKKVCNEGYNTKADEWSLAVTLMQMCSFQVPWHHYVKSSPALFEKLLHQPGLMQDCAKNANLVHCSAWWRDVLISMLSPQASARPSPGALLDCMDKKHQLSLPDFGALHEDVVSPLFCCDVDALKENTSDRLSLPDFSVLQEDFCDIS